MAGAGCGFTPGADERVRERIDGRFVLSIDADGTADAMERASRVEQRIATLLEKPEAIGSARVEPSSENRASRTVAVSGDSPGALGRRVVKESHLAALARNVVFPRQPTDLHAHRHAGSAFAIAQQMHVRNASGHFAVISNPGDSSIQLISLANPSLLSIKTWAILPGHLVAIGGRGPWADPLSRNEGVRAGIKVSGNGSATWQA